MDEVPPLSDTHRALLVEELQRPLYAGLDESQAYARLHSPQPVLESQPAVLTVSGIMELCGQVTLSRLAALPALNAIRNDIRAQDRESVVSWAAFLAGAAVLDQGEAADIVALCQATEERQVGESLPRLVEAFAGVPGFPNVIAPEAFASAWGEVTNGAA